MKVSIRFSNKKYIDQKNIRINAIKKTIPNSSFEYPIIKTIDFVNENNFDPHNEAFLRLKEGSKNSLSINLGPIEKLEEYNFDKNIFSSFASDDLDFKFTFGVCDHQTKRILGITQKIIPIFQKQKLSKNKISFSPFRIKYEDTESSIFKIDSSDFEPSDSNIPILVNKKLKDEIVDLESSFLQGIILPYAFQQSLMYMIDNGDLEDIENENDIDLGSWQGKINAIIFRLRFSDSMPTISSEISEKLQYIDNFQRTFFESQFSSKIQDSLKRLSRAIKND